MTVGLREVAVLVVGFDTERVPEVSGWVEDFDTGWVVEPSVLATGLCVFAFRD